MKLEFGKNLKDLRRAKDMTQDELAQALSLSVQAISRYETGAAYPDIEMLPVIAGFFGTTTDALLGVSGAAREKRMDEYTAQLRGITDRRERLALLRREHAEFPDCWDIVSDMVYEMTYLPDCLAEMREIVRDALRRCDEPLWRENMILFYLKAEPDEAEASAFIDKWSSKYDIRKAALYKHRYAFRQDHARLRALKQKLLRDELSSALLSLTERQGEGESLQSCLRALEFLDWLSGHTDRERLDMWVEVKLNCLLRLSNNYFALSQIEDGYAALETAISLFENFFALPSGTVLTYGSEKFDCLDARFEKQVYYGITEFSGMTAQSMMADLIYVKPIAPVCRDEKSVYDLEGFERTMVFSSHTCNILKSAAWDGFARVKNDERYLMLLSRAQSVSALENPDNLRFLISAGAARTDAFAKDAGWLCALLVPDVGAYVVWGNPGDAEAKIQRMKREGNTSVVLIAAAQIGGGLIPPPEALLRAVAELDGSNSTARVMLENPDGGTTYATVGELMRQI